MQRNATQRKTTFRILNSRSHDKTNRTGSSGSCMRRTTASCCVLLGALTQPRFWATWTGCGLERNSDHRRAAPAVVRRAEPPGCRQAYFFPAAVTSSVSGVDGSATRTPRPAGRLRVATVGHLGVAAQHRRVGAGGYIACDGEFRQPARLARSHFGVSVLRALGTSAARVGREDRSAQTRSSDIRSCQPPSGRLSSTE
jgi:hypothetical protein